MVVMALSWWIQAIELTEQQDLKLSTVIHDVMWVLLKLVSMLSSASMNTEKKHSREETTQKESVSKRCI